MTLDTGALIGLERTRKRIREIVAAARAGNGMFDLEPLDENLAKSAGQALASLRRGDDVDAGVTIDAIVMASAARRGDVVFTSDVDDLERFSRYFPNVRILSVRRRYTGYQTLRVSTRPARDT